MSIPFVPPGSGVETQWARQPVSGLALARVVDGAASVTGERRRDAVGEGARVGAGSGEGSGRSGQRPPACSTGRIRERRLTATHQESSHLLHFRENSKNHQLTLEFMASHWGIGMIKAKIIRSFKFLNLVSLFSESSRNNPCHFIFQTSGSVDGGMSMSTCPKLNAPEEMISGIVDGCSGITDPTNTNPIINNVPRNVIPPLPGSTETHAVNTDLELGKQSGEITQVTHASEVGSTGSGIGNTVELGKQSGEIT